MPDDEGRLLNIPRPPIKSEFGKKFAVALKPLQQATLETFDHAFAEARRLFRERYDAEIQIAPGFRQQIIDDPRKRRSLVDIVEAMESLPVKAVRGNPGLERIIVGQKPPPEHPEWRGGYSFGGGQVSVFRMAFEFAPRYVRDRSDAVFEVVLHETGHAVHWMLGWEKSKPFFDATWNLLPERQGEGIWGNQGQYLIPRRTGTIKSREGSTAYGRSDPVEDWADTWRILSLPDRRRRQLLSVDRRTRNEYARFKIMRKILSSAGIGVPD